MDDEFKEVIKTLSASDLVYNIGDKITFIEAYMDRLEELSREDPTNRELSISLDELEEARFHLWNSMDYLIEKENKENEQKQE